MRLVVLQGPQAGEFDLAQGDSIAGRDGANPIHLPSKRVSRRHCVFTVSGDRCLVKDMGSSNGVIVDGQRVESAELAHGARIQLGDYLISYSVQPFQIQTKKGAEPDIQTTPLGASAGLLAPGGLGHDPVSETGGFGQAPPPEPGGFGQAAPSEPIGFGQSAPPELSDGFGQAPPLEPDTFGVPAEDGVTFGGGYSPESAGGEPAGFGVPDQSFGGQPSMGGEAVGGGLSQELGAPGPAFDSPSGFGPAASGPGDVFGGGSAAEASHPAGPEGGLDAVAFHVQKFLKMVPWLGRFGLVFLVGLIFCLLAPVGGFVSIMGQSDSALERMAVQHGIITAEVLGRHNAPALAKGLETELDVLPVSRREGVVQALLLNTQGYVNAPAAKRGRTYANHELYGEALSSRRAGSRMHEGLLEVISPVVGSVQAGLPPSVVGYVFIQYETAKIVDTIAKPSRRLMAGIIVIVLGFTGCFIGGWQVATRPVKTLREETELAIRGHVNQVQSRVHWESMDQLAHSINRLLERMGGAQGMQSQQSGQPSELETVLEAVPSVLFVLDGSQRISQINRAALHVLGKSAPQTVGRPVLEVVTDPGVSGTLQHMLQCIGAGQGTIFSDHVSLGGQSRRLTVSGRLIGPGQVSHAVVVIS